MGNIYPIDSSCSVIDVDGIYDFYTHCDAYLHFIQSDRFISYRYLHAQCIMLIKVKMSYIIYHV